MTSLQSFLVVNDTHGNMQRRRFLKQAGGIGAIPLIAGCAGDDGGDTTTTTTTSTTTTTTTTNGGSTETLNIGVLLPFSGTYSWVGANVLPVVRMITEEINQAGGIDGRDVQVVQADTEASPDASLTAAQRLINVEGVEGIVGPTSITMSAVYDLFPQNQVPIVTPTAGTTSLDDRGGEYVFRTVASDSLGGRAIARAARDQQYNTITDYSRAALMIGNQEVFQSFKDPIRSSFEEFGGTVTTTIDFRTGKSSYSAEVQSMMNSNPEITVLVGPNDDSVRIMEAAYQAGYEGNWFGTQDQTNSEFLAQSEAAVTNNMLGLTAASYQPAEEAGVLADFRQRIFEYAGWDEMKIFATNAYDAMNIMGLAMRQTAAAGNSVTGANIAGNIRAVAAPPGQTVSSYTAGDTSIGRGSNVDYQGVVGPIDFDEDGDIVAPFAIHKASDNSWEQVSRLPPEALQ